MEHSYISSGKSPKRHSSVFSWTVFKLCSKKRPSTAHHPVIRYKCLEVLWLLLLFLHSASSYGLSSLPLVSSPQPHFIKECHPSPSSVDKWNGKSLHQREWEENMTGLFLNSAPHFKFEHTTFSLSPSHMWTAQRVHHLV